MLKTSEMTVNDAGSPETLSASVACRRIIVYEKPTASGWPRKWQWRAPLDSSTPAILAEGGSKIFEPSDGQTIFQANQIVAHLELLAGGGSTTFIIVEEL